LDLSRRARHAGGRGELEFVLVNDSHNIAPYRQAVLWLASGSVRALSGVFEIEKNAPYVHWLNRLCHSLDLSEQQVRVIEVDALPADVRNDLGEWMPSQILWLPLVRDSANKASAEGGVLFARELPWQQHEMELLAEWVDTWQSHYFHNIRHHSSWFGFSRASKNGVKSHPHWWRRPWFVFLVLLFALGSMPVKLNVLAPGELVPSNPFVVSAPLDGVVGDFYVKPNQNVKAGTPLFSLDDTTLYSRLDVARQTLATAEAAYRQSAQMAVFDPRAKVQLASLMGKIAEQRAEVSYVRNQLKRTKLVAPADGMALFDDPTEWIGKPVTTGEPIMRIAEVEDKEIEAWLAVADAVPLEQGAPVKFYLSASPLHPVEGKVRYMAYEAVQRPDGTYAYRVRASLTSETAYRLGLKGTVKVEGEQVRLAYWVLRRPWSVLRQYLGV
jgi:hypothetical protein